MRILFSGGHDLGKYSLRELVNKNINICGVIVTETEDNWYKGVDEIALSYNLDLHRTKNINSEKSLEYIKELEPDLIVLVNFNQILNKNVISIPKKGLINIHASLLPNYRGRAPLNWAIINGESQVGVTTHYVSEDIDEGDIIIQEKIDIEDNEYIGDILDRVKELYPKVLLRTVKKISDSSTKVGIKQDISKGSYYGRRTEKDGIIDWSQSSKDIYNLIRAVSKPYPGARTNINGRDLIVWRADIVELESKYDNCIRGEVLEITKKGILVKVDERGLFIYEYDYIN